MRCQYMIKVWFFETVLFTEPDDDGVITTFRVQRPTWCMQQCPVTTKQKHNKCWKELQMCGVHAAVTNPLFYPKAKGHLTGGRHGLDKSINLIEVPLIRKVDHQHHDS